MKIKPLVLGHCLLMLKIFGLCYTASFDDSAFPGSSVVFTNNRFFEIDKHCRPFLNSASELKPDDTRGYRIKNELSFFNGDWEQQSGGASLMPFDDTDIDMPTTDLSSRVSPLRLVSFEVKDVNSLHQSNNTVGLSGVMTIGISRNSTFVSESSYSNFYMRPGLSSLKIVFQGVYIETEENQGEHLICLLGDSTLPVFNLIDEFSDTAENFGTDFIPQPKLSHDDQIFLVLRYPRTFKLTERAIRGVMRSLNERESFKYFDEVLISSQLGSYSKYQFSTEELKPRICDPSPLEDEMVQDGFNVFNGSEFCRVLKYFSNVAYNVEPNWRYRGRYLNHNTMGPFQFKKEIIDWHYGNVKLMIQNIICEDDSSQYNTQNAKVSAVLRVFPAKMEQNFVAGRTGISGTTLSVEGIWNSSAGQLFMIGCLGIIDPNFESCDSQISLYFPRSLSIMQRSIVVGSISRITNEADSYFPVLFRMVKNPSDLHYNDHWYVTPYLSYNYSKCDLANVFRERSQSSKLVAIIRQSLLKCPALEEKQELVNSLHHLFNDFYLSGYAIPSHWHDVHKSELSVKVEVLSFGSLLGYDPRSYIDRSPENILSEFTKSKVLNVSLHLTFTDITYKKSWRMFLEGLYDPLVGQMYLIGCKEVSDESTNIERGLDCLNEVRIEYPSKTLRWLINPSAKISVTSRRNEDDRLYFSPISVRTSMIRYEKHEDDVIFRKVFEGVLRVILLLVSISIILSQLFYMKKNEEAIPYISLVTLAIQILGYSLPLISRTEILFDSKESVSYRKIPYVYYGYQMLIKVLDYSAKLLVLAALLLTARIFQMVSNSRKGLDDNGTSKSVLIPSERRVLRITLVVHTLFFLLFFLPFRNDIDTSRDSYMLKTLMIKFGDFMVREFFLLPQFIGNWLWKPRVRPLKKIYILGFTLRTILLMFYDQVRDPIVDPYSVEVAF